MIMNHKVFTKMFLDEFYKDPKDREAEAVALAAKRKAKVDTIDAGLLNCVCGRHPKIVSLGRHTSGHGESTETFKVECGCGLCGPELSDYSPREDLVKAWNGIISGIKGEW